MPWAGPPFGQKISEPTVLRSCSCLDHALDEQLAVIVAAGAAEEDEVAVAVHVIGDAEPRLERAVERIPVVAVGNIVFRIDAARCPARIVRGAPRRSAAGVT